MKQHILDTFQFNNSANLQMIVKIATLKDQDESIRLMSHLTNSMFRWMAVVTEDPLLTEKSWWDPLYSVEELAPKWDECYQLWKSYMESITEETLNTETEFKGADGNVRIAKPVDIALQLNYHCIHHRAQIQMLIRAQGVEPEFVDYIAGRFKFIQG